MSELATQMERIAFWGDATKQKDGSLTGATILIMSSGKADAVIGNEAAANLTRLGCNVLLGGSDVMFTSGGTTGEYAYLHAFDDADATVFINPTETPSDNGMIRSMKSVATKALKYADAPNAVVGGERKVESYGTDKIIVINPRHNSPPMAFVGRAKGGVYEMGALNAGSNFIASLATIVHLE